MNNLKHYAKKANLKNRMPGMTLHTNIGYLFYPNSSNRNIANNQGRNLINREGEWLHRFKAKPNHKEILKALQISKLDLLWTKIE